MLHLNHLDFLRWDRLDASNFNMTHGIKVLDRNDPDLDDEWKKAIEVLANYVDIEERLAAAYDDVRHEVAGLSELDRGASSVDEVIMKVELENIRSIANTIEQMDRNEAGIRQELGKIYETYKDCDLVYDHSG